MGAMHPTTLSARRVALRLIGILIATTPVYAVHAQEPVAPAPAISGEPTPRHSLIQRPKKKPHASDPSTGKRAGQPKPPAASVTPSSVAPPTAGPVNSRVESETASSHDGTAPPPTQSEGKAGMGFGSSLLPRNAVGSVTQPSVPLLTTTPGGTGSVLAAPTAEAGSSGSSQTPTSRGFSNLLSKFPTLGPTLNLSTPPASSGPNTNSPVPTDPVPVVSAPPPSSPPPAGVSMGAVQLSWNPNREPDLAGYKIYMGTRSGVYDYPGSPFAVGNTTQTTISNLPHGHTYYFSASAYDLSGNESALAPEVSKSLY